jgi:uncharacterized protein YejL (UPF0352 family)
MKVYTINILSDEVEIIVTALWNMVETIEASDEMVEDKKNSLVELGNLIARVSLQGLAQAQQEISDQRGGAKR